MPRNITVTFADGSSHTYQGAPDDVTPDQVEARASQEFGKPVKSLDGGRAAAAVSEPTKPKTLMQSAGDLLAGGVRGAGSIGATILAPIDMAKDAIAGKGLSLESNRQRRADMDAALNTLGADTDSTAYKVGKLGAEIAGTAGVGGAIAKPVHALAGTRFATGIEPILEGVAKGLQTGGFRVGELAGTGLGTAVRVGTGATVGGATAGLVNPSDAGTGALIGGVLPGATALAGRAGAALRGRPAATQQTPEMIDTARRSMDAGYIIPPSQVNPSFKNRTLESLSGKFETAQLASTKNQEVTNSLVRKSLGMADDAPLTQEAMKQVRSQAGQVYQQLKGTGMVTADKPYLDALDDIAKTVKSATAAFPKLGKTNMHGQPIDEISELVNGLKQGQFDAGGAVDAISVLRDNADAAYRAGNNALGKANKAGSKALEDMLDRHLQQIGATDMLPAYRNARALIAKTYTVEKGLREGAGTVDARALGRELQKKKPLSGELRTVAEFGNTFNKAAQPPHLIGSPGVNALKPLGSLLTGGLGAATMGPGGVTLGALNYALPPVARSLMFSKGAQRGLLGSGTALLDEAAPMGLLTSGAYRALPLLSAQ